MCFPSNRPAFAAHAALMAKALSKSQIAASLAETVGLTKKQAVQTLEALVALAYKNAKNSFTIPGLGKIVLVNRKARMGRNPATGETIKIAAKRVVKFRVAKAAKDAILGVKKKPKRIVVVVEAKDSDPSPLSFSAICLPAIRGWLAPAGSSTNPSIDLRLTGAFDIPHIRAMLFWLTWTK